MNKEVLVIIIQILINLLIITIIALLIMLNSAVKLEKRITKHSIKFQKDKVEKSVFDNISNKYMTFVKKQRKKISKLFPNLIKRYDKYVTDGVVKAPDFITHKIIICFIFDLLVLFGLAIHEQLMDLSLLVICSVFGFFILDIILIITNLFKKKRIENDMLQAIIIMNNAFKSGKSTIQAVEIASQKLPKPINQEFKRIHQELKYGLSIDIAFDRFAKRINIEEAEYLSSSLSILNKTGGNIIGVFNSIEKTLFDKKKLNEELKNSTTVSNLVTKILLFVPILITLIIYILDPTYFNPFLQSIPGIILLCIALIMFIIYAYILNKIVKVDY